MDRIGFGTCGNSTIKKKEEISKKKRTGERGEGKERGGGGREGRGGEGERGRGNVLHHELYGADECGVGVVEVVEELARAVHAHLQ